MLNHPESGLAAKMEYYIKPVDTEPDFIRLNSPEEIRICDPCCGSGHMLTYAFDVLFEIYSELGYTTKDAVEHLIRDNLYGIELDDRAGQLAYFALMMKAREKVRRFFSSGIEPNICVLHNVTFDEEDLRIACSLFSNTRDAEVKKLLTQFEHADTFGSLIIPCIDDIGKLKNNLTKTTWTGDLFDGVDTIEPRVHEVLKYADYLSSNYQVVITNPPYMGNYDDITKAFVTKNYPDSKSDLCTAFMERNWKLTVPKGYSAMVNMQSWMFLPSLVMLREKFIRCFSVVSLIHIGPRGFDSINGEVVQTVAFVTTNNPPKEKGIFIRLVDGKNENEKALLFLRTVAEKKYYLRMMSEFSLIPSSPLIYWISQNALRAFSSHKVEDILYPKTGLTTGNNELFFRLWYEVENNKVGLRWFPVNSGGRYRKWFGNNDYVIDWENKGRRIKREIKATIRNEQYYFSEGVTWSKICSGNLSGRYSSASHLFDAVGLTCFADNEQELFYFLAFMCSKVATFFAQMLNPTLSYTVGTISSLPWIYDVVQAPSIHDKASECVVMAKLDWDSLETSWDFSSDPLVRWSGSIWDSTSVGAAVSRYYGTRPSVSCPLELCYLLYKGETNERFDRLKENEEELNRIFIDIYGLQDELTPEEDDSMVSVHRIFDSAEEIPASMKNGNYALTKKDVMKSFVSYAVGCMFGRYSLCSDGLAYAGGDWNPSLYGSFVPAEDNVIPVLNDEWFSDDIVFRFREFVRVCFGDDSLSANMRFIEDALGMNIRNYFVREFYKDHLKTYQKRPIYWLFSSPKGYFNALVYLHRYNSNTASAVLGYLRRFRDKLSTEIGALERENSSRNAKKLVNFRKMAEDLDDYERILFPIAMEKISLDLDDGVKVNYAKLGSALKKVPGLEKSE